MKRVLCCLLCVVFLGLMSVVPVSAADAPYGCYNIIDNSYRGDVDGDGEVDVIDVTLIMRRIAYIEIPSYGAQDYYFYRLGDVDLDGWITIMDVSFIQRWLCGVPVKYAHVGESVSGLHDGSQLEDFYALEVYAALRNQGFDNNHIAGVLAYFDVESNIDPTMVEGYYLISDSKWDQYCFDGKAGLFYVDNYGTLNYDALDYHVCTRLANAYHDSLNISAYQYSNSYIHYMPGIGLYGVTGVNGMRLVNFASRYKNRHLDWHNVDVQMIYLLRHGNTFNMDMSAYKRTYVSDASDAAIVIASAGYGGTMGTRRNLWNSNALTQSAAYWRARINTWYEHDFVDGRLVDFDIRFNNMLKLA